MHAILPSFMLLSMPRSSPRQFIMNTSAAPLSSPLRLHLPAACITLSSPAQSLITQPNETSTPASMTCVEMQTTFGASGFVRFLSSALFISDITAILCAMHIPAERWKITVFSNFILVNRYAACFLRLHMTSRLSVVPSCSAINAGIASSRMPPLSIICVRLNTRHSSSSNGAISFIFSVIGCAVCSRHG